MKVMERDRVLIMAAIATNHPATDREIGEVLGKTHGNVAVHACMLRKKHLVEPGSGDRTIVPSERGYRRVMKLLKVKAPAGLVVQ